MRTDEASALEILSAYRVWAVVGCSDDPWRSSNSVASLLVERGYDVIPVNPAHTTVLDRTCYPSLRDVPRPVEVVDLFRRSEYVGAHVDEAIAIGAKVVWMQLGVYDEAAVARARAAGLEVVVDRCPAQLLHRVPDLAAPATSR